MDAVEKLMKKKDQKVLDTLDKCWKGPSGIPEFEGTNGRKVLDNRYTEEDIDLSWLEWNTDIGLSGDSYSEQPVRERIARVLNMAQIAQGNMVDFIENKLDRGENVRKKLVWTEDFYEMIGTEIQEASTQTFAKEGVYIVSDPKLIDMEKVKIVAELDLLGEIPKVAIDEFNAKIRGRLILLECDNMLNRLIARDVTSLGAYPSITWSTVKDGNIADSERFELVSTLYTFEEMFPHSSFALIRNFYNMREIEKLYDSEGRNLENETKKKIFKRCKANILLRQIITNERDLMHDILFRQVKERLFKGMYTIKNHLSHYPALDTVHLFTPKWNTKDFGIKYPTSIADTFEGLVPEMSTTLATSTNVDGSHTLVDILEEMTTDESINQVKQVDITLYRTSSDIVNSLIKFAEAGVKVNVVMEIRARLDETRNIKYAKKLRKVGADVIYTNKKLHAKMFAIKYKKKCPYSDLVMLSTGNFNSKTFNRYSDLYVTYTKGKSAPYGEIRAAITHLVESAKKGKDINCQKHDLFRMHRIHSMLNEVVHKATNNTDQNYDVFIKCNGINDDYSLAELSALSNLDNVTLHIITRMSAIKISERNLNRFVQPKDIILHHERIYGYTTSNDGEEYHGRVMISSGDLMNRNLNRIEFVHELTNEDVNFGKLHRVFLEQQLMLD